MNVNCADSLFYQAMLDAVCRTFEEMLFTQVFPCQGSAYGDHPGADAVRASLLVNGSVLGEIDLVMPVSLLSQLTGYFFSISQKDVSVKQMGDILGELLNMLSGCFMTTILPDEQDVEFGLPQLGEGDISAEDENTFIWNLTTGGAYCFQVFASGRFLLDSKP